MICAPDSPWVYFQNVHDRNLIERVPLEGGTPERIGASLVPNTVNNLGLSVSRDGKLLAFSLTQSDTQKVQLAVVDLTGSPAASAARFLDADARLSDHPEFTPDGKAIVYAMEIDGVENLWLQPLAGGSPRQITHFARDVFAGYSYAPDGKTLGVLRFHSDSDVVLLRDSRSSN